jgi:hypothetical protein
MSFEFCLPIESDAVPTGRDGFAESHSQRENVAGKIRFYAVFAGASWREI